MKFLRWPKDVNTLAVVCTQWGDTGKGKFIDFFAEEADLIARGTGGDNAGHTFYVDGKKHITHLIPSSICHTGKTHIIGSGVAFNPMVFMQELDILVNEGISYDNLLVALNAKLILPWHLLIDRLRERCAGKIGTTGRGITPTYVDHYKRIGLMVNDMLNPDIFRDKLLRNLEDNLRIINGYNSEDIVDIMQDKALGGGDFYANGSFEVDALIECYLQYGKSLSSMIADTDEIVREAVHANRRVLLEGAQGVLLSIDYGTYPYVTSSDASIHGLAQGVGISVKFVDRVFAIVKAPYMTRVGDGPFPTEMGGEQSMEWCRTKGIDRESEMQRHPDASLSDINDDEFLLGIAVRKAGAEYGATTGRPRRTGWLDIPLLRHAIKVMDEEVEIVLTKLDVLSGCPTIRVCYSYCYEGPNQRIGKRTLCNGDILNVAIPYAEIIRHCRPLYRDFDGWEKSITGARSIHDLPSELVQIISFIREKTKSRISILSVGPNSEQTIQLAV